MTVQTFTNTKSHLTLDAITVDFSYDFLVTDAAHMEVYLDNVLESAANYVVENVGTPTGGNVKMNTPPAANVVVLLVRVVPIDQLTDYRPYDPFPAESHEDALDKLTMIDQQQGEQLDRSILAVPGSAVDFAYNFGSASERANKLWAFDPAGLVVIAIDAAEDKAYRWAEENEDVVVERILGIDQFSAHHWSIKASAIVGLPFQNIGDILTGIAPGGPGSWDIFSIGLDGQVLVVDPAAPQGLRWGTLPQLLPPLVPGDKLKALQVNVAEDGYELTGQFATTLLTGDELWQSDESNGETSIEYVPHHKLIGAKFVNPGISPAHAQGFARFILRRHDVLAYTFALRLSKTVGDANIGDVRFRATPFVYPPGVSSVDPSAGIPIEATVTLNNSDTESVFMFFPSLIPLGGGEPDVLVVIQIDRIRTGNTYEGEVDALTCSVEAV